MNRRRPKPLPGRDESAWDRGGTPENTPRGDDGFVREVEDRLADRRGRARKVEFEGRLDTFGGIVVLLVFLTSLAMFTVGLVVTARWVAGHDRVSGVIAGLAAVLLLWWWGRAKTGGRS